MAIIGHVRKIGHKCRNPFGASPKARDIKAGEIMQYGSWELFYNASHQAYVVCRVDKTGDWHQVFNLNCAAAIMYEEVQKEPAYAKTS